jgi:endonuclease YncB( thermonuclease family)
MAMFTSRLALLLLLVLAAPSAAEAQAAAAKPGDVVQGVARVTDSDKLVVNNVYIRLWGVDGPELGQPCFFTNRQQYDCQSIALRELEIITAQGPVTCTIENDPSRLRRGKIYCTCLTSEGRDVAEELVKAGHALAFVEQTDKYKQVEAVAEEKKVGLFRGPFQEPWVFAASITGAGL